MSTSAFPTIHHRTLYQWPRETRPTGSTSVGGRRFHRRRVLWHAIPRPLLVHAYTLPRNHTTTGRRLRPANRYLLPPLGSAALGTPRVS
ncbi:hypothetical protein BDZ89DRAFT_1073338 [Hymenopellis radicata]|nr:hypothetical protein BDZ89DRAFT_1073338 [Hymenopellis radicata]